MAINKKSFAYTLRKYDVQYEAVALFACFWGLVLVVLFWGDARSGEGSEENLEYAGLLTVLFFTAMSLLKITIKLRAYKSSRRH